MTGQQSGYSALEHPGMRNRQSFTLLAKQDLERAEVFAIIHRSEWMINKQSRSWSLAHATAYSTKRYKGRSVISDIRRPSLICYSTEMHRDSSHVRADQLAKTGL